MYLDPKAKLPHEKEEVVWKEVKPRNKFLELLENTTRCKNILKPETNKIFIREAGDHPYKETIGTLNTNSAELYAAEYVESRFTGRSLESVPLHWIDTAESLSVMYLKLKDEPIIAVDLEHHSFHSYNGLVSLMQISSATEDFIVDTIRLREVLQSSEYSLNTLFANPAILKIFHGAESDIAWLQRDFDTFIVNMFDSYHAARLIQLPRLSLAYLLERYLSVELDKKYQLADWRERPLTSEMIDYARKDTHYLIQLYFLLKQELSLSQFEEVLNKSNQQCLVLYQPEVLTDRSWTVVLDRFNFRFDPAQIELTKAIFYWREERAKALDVSPAAIMPNAWIPRLVQSKAKTAAEIRSCLRNIPDLLISELPSLIEVLNKSIEVSVPVSEPTASNSTPVHCRFDEDEERKPENAQIEAKRPRLESGRTISFASKSATTSAASVFGAPKTASKATATILLSSIVKQSLPVVQPEAFVSSKEAQEAIEEKKEESEEEEKVVEEVKVHGSNRTISDLKLTYNTSSSTEVVQQLRLNTDKKSFNPKPVEPVDFNAIKESILHENTTAPVFDPYRNIEKDKNKQEPFIKAMPTVNAPRLSSTPFNGNRTATFTKKSMKK